MAITRRVLIDIAFWLAIAVGAGLWFWYVVVHNDELSMAGRVRFKLSMTLQVDGRQVTASTVQEVGYEDLPGILRPGNQPNPVLLRGDSLAVDLGGLGSLFLLRLDGYLVEQSCGAGWSDSVAGRIARLRAVLKSCDLRLNGPSKFNPVGYPRFLRAAPFNRELPPLKPTGNTYEAPAAPDGFVVFDGTHLTSAFDGHVTFLRAWFEPTDEPLSTNSLAKVAWLQPILDGRVSDMQAPIIGSSYELLMRRDFARDTFQ